MRSEEVFERAGVWPIEIAVGDKAGATLWANTEGDDYLLAVRSRVLVFATWDRLRDFVHSDQVSNLSRLPGYRRFLAAAQASPRLLSQPYARYRTATLLGTMDEDWSEWSVEDASEALDVLNILWDIAVTVDDRVALGLLQDKAGLGKLLDTLTTFDPARRDEFLGLDQAAIRARCVDLVALASTNLVVFERTAGGRN